MALAIGPCMFVAPLVFVVGLLLLPLWPVAIVVVAVTWVIVWPVEQILVLMHVRRVRGMSARVGKALKFTLKPWTLFDPPRKPGA